MAYVLLYKPGAAPGELASYYTTHFMAVAQWTWRREHAYKVRSHVEEEDLIEQLEREGHLVMPMSCNDLEEGP